MVKQAKSCVRVLCTYFYLVVINMVSPAFAESGIKPILNIATIPLPPWGYKKPNRAPTGICYEWANAIAKRMGRKAHNRILPMSRVFKALEYGRADFSIMLRTPSSEKISVPVANVGIPFRTIIWPRKDMSIGSYADLTNIRLSMARGLKVGGKFKDQKNLNITSSIDYIHSMHMFKANRVDAIVGTEQSLAYNAKRIGLSPQKDFGTPFELAKLEGWVQASHDYIEREGLENIQKAATSLIEDGTFEAIYKKYTLAPQN